MEPLLLGDGFQVERTLRASHAAGAAADALVPVVDGLGVGGQVQGMGEELAPPDALSA